MNVNRVVEMALKTGLYLLQQSDKATAEMRERVKDRMEEVSHRARRAVHGPEDHTLRNAVSLLAGVGAGVALGMLFAPAKGEETRSSIAEKVQDASTKVPPTLLFGCRNADRYRGKMTRQPGSTCRR